MPRVRGEQISVSILPVCSFQCYSNHDSNTWPLPDLRYTRTADCIPTPYLVFSNGQTSVQSATAISGISDHDRVLASCSRPQKTISQPHKVHILQNGNYGLNNHGLDEHYEEFAETSLACSVEKFWEQYKTKLVVIYRSHQSFFLVANNITGNAWNKHFIRRAISFQLHWRLWHKMPAYKECAKTGQASLGPLYWNRCAHLLCVDVRFLSRVYEHACAS